MFCSVLFCSAWIRRWFEIGSYKDGVDGLGLEPLRWGLEFLLGKAEQWRFIDWICLFIYFILVSESFITRDIMAGKSEIGSRRWKKRRYLDC